MRLFSGLCDFQISVSTLSGDVFVPVIPVMEFDLLVELFVKQVVENYTD